MSFLLTINKIIIIFWLWMDHGEMATLFTILLISLSQHLAQFGNLWHKHWKIIIIYQIIITYNVSSSPGLWKHLIKCSHFCEKGICNVTIEIYLYDWLGLIIDNCLNCLRITHLRSHLQYIINWLCQHKLQLRMPSEFQFLYCCVGRFFRSDTHQDMLVSFAEFLNFTHHWFMHHKAHAINIYTPVDKMSSTQRLWLV